MRQYNKKKHEIIPFDQIAANQIYDRTDPRIHKSLCGPPSEMHAGPINSRCRTITHRNYRLIKCVRAVSASTSAWRAARSGCRRRCRCVRVQCATWPAISSATQTFHECVCVCLSIICSRIRAHICVYTHSRTPARRGTHFYDTIRTSC